MKFKLLMSNSRIWPLPIFLKSLQSYRSLCSVPLTFILPLTITQPILPLGLFHLLCWVVLAHRSTSRSLALSQASGSFTWPYYTGSAAEREIWDPLSVFFPGFFPLIDSPWSSLSLEPRTLPGTEQVLSVYQLNGERRGAEVTQFLSFQLT